MTVYYDKNANVIQAEEKPEGWMDWEEYQAFVKRILTSPTIEDYDSIDDLIAEFTRRIQRRLDVFAKTRGYDGILSAATYATSGDLDFSVEGQYAVDVRDSTWRKAYEILGDVTDGLRPLPTWEELEAELPALKWPGSDE